MRTPDIDQRLIVAKKLAECDIETGLVGAMMAMSYWMDAEIRKLNPIDLQAEEIEDEFIKDSGLSTRCKGVIQFEFCKEFNIEYTDVKLSHLGDPNYPARWSHYTNMGNGSLKELRYYLSSHGITLQEK